MSKFHFEAVLVRPEGVGTWTYLDIPLNIAEVFGAKGQIKVKGTINGYPFRSTALPHGDGTHYLVVGKAIRDTIHATQGEMVQVIMELDREARQVDIPPDLEQALAADPQARAAFEKLSYTHQKEYLEWIQSARKDETRQRRIEKTIEKLSEGNSLGD
jgi:hypothetical protein